MDWLIVFSVVLAVLAMFKSSVKRIVANRIQGVGRYMIWDRWTKFDGSSMPSESDGTGYMQNELNIQAKTGATQYMHQNIHERDGTITYNANQTRLQRSASMSTPKDQQYIFDHQGLKDLKVDIDTSKQ